MLIVSLNGLLGHLTWRHLPEGASQLNYAVGLTGQHQLLGLGNTSGTPLAVRGSLSFRKMKHGVS
jgi:hypothetical protein